MTFWTYSACIGVLLLFHFVTLDAWIAKQLPISSRDRICATRPSSRLQSAVENVTSAVSPASTPSKFEESGEGPEQRLDKLQGRLLKRLRRAAKEYEMLEKGDKIMVCVSGGKDSATLLYLLRNLRERLRLDFEIVAAHVDQKQPGYDGGPLINWMQDEFPEISYHHIEEDTYSIVVDKTPEDKSFCTVCSRLRRGILYSKAIELGCNKIALGHHADDAAETLFLNMIHGGTMKGMPARYTSARGSLAVLRPLIFCHESDIAEYAAMRDFPILPCNLCNNQDALQRPQMKLLLGTLEQFNVNAKQNILNAMSSVRPSHLLDQDLRESCGMDAITGDVLEDENEPI